MAKGIKAALNLSSGYHNPLRFLRHLITVWSEIRPTTVAPTVKKKKKELSINPSVHLIWHENRLDYEPMLPIPEGNRQAPINASFFM